MKLHRTLRRIWKDGVYPGRSSVEPVPEQDGIRYEAAVNVLCRLPHVQYEQFLGVADTVHWFIPQTDDWTKPAPIGARVIHLPAKLDQLSFELVVCFVAHEVVALLIGPFESVAEEEIGNAMCEWGFQSEVDHTRAHVQAQKCARNEN